jgi:uncharacterized protein YvpB
MVNIKPFLQRDYGAAQDCTLVSILTILQKYSTVSNPSNMYNVIESIAKKYHYNGDKWGTIPFFIKKIMQEAYSVFNIKAQCKVKYGKGIGYTFNTVKNLINRNIPVVLSLYSDGVGKYNNHSVVIVDYDDKTKEFIIFDNWTTTPQRVKYSKLCMISCINWSE